MSSPRPQSANFHLAHGNSSETHIDSPLGKSSFPSELPPKVEFESSLSQSLHAPSDASLVESEVEDQDVIHVDAPGRRVSKIYGGDGNLDSTEDLGPGAENHGIHDEHGYSAPILASDEVAKEPFGWELQPAVSPQNDRRGSGYEDGLYHHRSGSQTSLSGSRPTSRPGSIHGNIPGLRFTESKPLEDLDEYEPLFPEDEKNTAGVKKPLTAADKLKRPELQNRKFPSQDIWEDSPNSLQYTATVSTPQLPEDEEASEARRHQSETPAQAFARKQEELAEAESHDSESFLNREKKPWAHKAHLVAETRPSMRQRFPSRDIWEDTPDSLQLQTTVAGPQSDEKEVVSPPEDRPTTGAVTYHQEKAAAGLPLSNEEGRATTGIAALMKPQIPARPSKSKPSESPDRSQPTVPERPQRSKPAAGVESTSPPVPMKAKPMVPARPSKPITRESSENVPLSTVPSNSSARSVSSDQSAAAAAKPKPPVPSRTLGSKIAALQGGFMSDLNKRLQLGPQAPKKEEPAPEAEEEVKEKAPLTDARKGRARGPARRAPAKSPAPANATVTETSSTLSFSAPSTLWAIDPEEDQVYVASHGDSVHPDVTSKAAESETPALATNTTSQLLHKPSKVTLDPEKVMSPPSAVADAQSEHVEDAEKEIVASGSDNHDLEPVKPSDEPPVVSKSDLASEPVEEEHLSSSTATLKPDTENVE
jgi:hypothetical protein